MVHLRSHPLIRGLSALFLVLLMTSTAWATDKTVTPEDFAVGKLFKKYARHSATTFVNLSATALEGKQVYGIDSLSHVAILRIKSPTETLVRDVEETIETDKSLADDIQEAFAQGYLVSAAYRLHTDTKESVYLLYRYSVNEGHIVISYLQGRVDPKVIAGLVTQKTVRSPQKHRPNRTRPSKGYIKMARIQ